MLFDKLLSYTLGILFLLMLACSGPDTSDDARVITVQRELRHDPAFWDYAASSNMLQVEMGKLAQTKGTAAKTQALGQQAANYHGKALQRLKEMMAEEKQVRVPDSLGGADQGLVKEMMALEGSAFDTRYREFVIRTHTSQLDRYEEALRLTDDQATREWLTDMRLHLREQLNMLANPDSIAAPAL